jgi:hypothetical protein
VLVLGDDDPPRHFNIESIDSFWLLRVLRLLRGLADGILSNTIHLVADSLLYFTGLLFLLIFKTGFSPIYDMFGALFDRDLICLKDKRES